MGSEREFQRAIELNPSYAFAHDQFGMALAFQGLRLDEAAAEGSAEPAGETAAIEGARKDQDTRGLLFIVHLPTTSALDAHGRLLHGRLLTHRRPEEHESLLHWSDFSTLELIAAVARHSKPVRLMILGTYRQMES